MCSAQVVGLLFECEGRSVVFRCEPEGLCLKLIRQRGVFEAEQRAYEQLKGSARALFLPILFFCQVQLQSGSTWRGYVMRQGLYSLRDVLYKPSRFSQAEYDAVLQHLLREREEGGRSSCKDAKGGGVPVVFKGSQSVQLSLSLAALRLLQRLHKEGWAHGDSHLGNFMYCGGRVFAIDFERSFPTTDPVQHLLDVQELFGHISGLLIHVQHPNEWDMRDIQAVYFHR